MGCPSATDESLRELSSLNRRVTRSTVWEPGQQDSIYNVYIAYQSIDAFKQLQVINHEDTN